MLHKFVFFLTQTWNYIALQEFNVYTHTQIYTYALCSDNGVNPRYSATPSSPDIEPPLLNDHEGLEIDIPHYIRVRFIETFDKTPPSTYSQKRR